MVCFWAAARLAGMPRKLRVEYEGAIYHVHLNPVRARLLKPEQKLKTYRWSSWPEYLKKPARRFSWMRVDRLNGEWGVKDDSAAGHRQLELGMEQRRELEDS